MSLPRTVNLPCCGSKTTLQAKQKHPDHWFRTCTNVMCQQPWDIHNEPDGLTAYKAGPKPKAFTL